MTEPLRESGNQWSSGHQGGRIDMGYGTLNQRFQKHRSAADTFPYVPDDEYEDAPDADEDDLAAIKSKRRDYAPTDSFIDRRPTTQYFSSPSGLAACFWRQEQVLAEIAAFGDSLVPIPHASRGKNVTAGSGGAFPYSGGGGSNAKRTGSLKGWSQSPPPSKVAAEDNIDEFDEDEHTYSLRDMVNNEKESGRFVK